MKEHLREYLEKNKINYVLHKHKAVFTVAESGKDENIMKIPGMHCKTLFLKDDLERFYLVGLPAYKRMDIKKVEKYFGLKKLRFGSKEELDKIKLEPGSVSIFGAIYSSEVILIIDKDVWDADIVGFHPNVNTETLEVKHEDLERYYNSLDNEKEIMKL